MVNTGIHFFNICVLSFSNKKIHNNRAGHNFFNALCKRARSSLQKRKHHKWLFSYKNKKFFFLNYVIFQHSSSLSDTKCRQIFRKTWSPTKELYGDWNRYCRRLWYKLTCLHKHVVYISRLCFCLDNKTDIKTLSLSPVTRVTHSLSGMDLWKVVERKLHSKITALFKDCRNFSSALSLNRVLRVPCYSRTVSISALRYMETAFWEYRVIEGLSQFQLCIIWKPHFESTVL